MKWLRAWRQRRACFHHNPTGPESWIADRLVDGGRAKHFWCTRCGRYWTR